MSTPYLHRTETKVLLQVKKDLERHEDYREYAYPDPISKIGKRYRGENWPWGFTPARGLLALISDMGEKDGLPWTVGFGFTRYVTPDSRIQRIPAERMLERHIMEMNRELAHVLPWYMAAPFVVKTVLINMAFNLGLRGFLRFKNTLDLVKAQNYTSAAHNMTLSLWYKQVGARAKELVKRMRTQTIEPQHQAPEVLR